LPFVNAKSQPKVALLERRRISYSGGIPEDADIAELANYFIQAILEAKYEKLLAEQKRKESKADGKGKMSYEE
jgi:hypothetical protein